MPYSKQLTVQIENLFDADIYQQGRVLQQANMVSHLQKTPHITAQVNDPQLGNCNTFININLQGERLQVDGECSCEQEFNCSHVAATLLQYIDVNVVAKKIQTSSVSLNSVDNESVTESEIHYVLSLQQQTLLLNLFLISDKKTTAYTVKLPLKNPPRFVLSQDKLLFQLLVDEACVATGSAFILHQNSDTIIRALIQSGCCHWLDVNNPKLQFQLAQPGKWSWLQYADGRQQLVPDMKDDLLMLLPASPFLYVDIKSHAVGLVNTGLAQLEDQRLFNLPVFHVGDIHAALNQSPLQELADKLPAPQLAKTLNIKQYRPQTGLRIFVKKNITGKVKKHDLKVELQLVFHYPGCCINYNNTATYVGQFLDNDFIQWQRDTAFELACIKQIKNAGWRVIDEQNNLFWHLSDDVNGQAAAKFLALECPEFLQQGWNLEIENAPNILDLEQLFWKINFSVAEHPHKISFSIQLENNINLLHVIKKNLKQGWLKSKKLAENDYAIMLTDNQQLIVISTQHLKKLLNCLLELNATKALDKKGALLLSRGRFQAVHKLLETLSQELTMQINLSAELKNIQALNELEKIKDNALTGVNAQLRDYQQQGVDWLHRLYRHQLGGLLADDMGLGKTLQVLTFLWQCKCRGQLTHPVLILAPTSVLSNWLAEIKKFTPDFKSLLLHGPQRHPCFSSIADCDLIITSYPLLIRDQMLLLEYPWQMLILDEAQAIKNPHSLTSKAVREFNAPMNICISGTPIENHLGELWALFDFTLPGLLGEQHQFNDWFREPIENRNDELQHDLLVERVSPVMLRRSKAEVLPQLPQKVHQTIFIELDDAQQQMYDSIHQQMSKNLRDNIRDRGLNASRMHILDALTRLRQICCEPRLLSTEFISDENTPASSKLNRLLNMLDEMLDQGRKILIFSQFTSFLSLLEADLKRKNIDYALLTGQTKKREEQIKRFQLGEVPLFLISLKAGGSGLNLTQADTVIHYDPWWNPAVENQATDRAHRIGQNKSVMVYKLIAANTIEEKIIEMQKNKQNIADNLLQGASQKIVNSRDLNGLLNLLEIDL